MRTVGIFLVLALVAAASVHAAENPLTSSLNEGGREILYYPIGECDAEIAAECAIASISCSENGMLYLDVWGLSTADVRLWFNNDNPAATIEGLNPKPTELTLDSITANVMNGDWTAQLMSWGPSWLTNTSTAKKMIVHHPSGELALPLAAGDRKNLRRLADAC